MFVEDVNEVTTYVRGLEQSGKESRWFHLPAFFQKGREL